MKKSKDLFLFLFVIVIKLIFISGIPYYKKYRKKMSLLENQFIRWKKEDFMVRWKKEDFLNIQKTDPEKLVTGREYIMVYESLLYTGIFLHCHIQFPKYKFFRVNNKIKMFGSGFSNYDVGKLLVSYFDEITQLLPEELLYMIQSFL